VRTSIRIWVPHILKKKKVNASTIYCTSDQERTLKFKEQLLGIHENLRSYFQNFQPVPVLAVPRDELNLVSATSHPTSTALMA
jgi:hypothetical protein